MAYSPVPLIRHFSLVPRTDADSDEREVLSIWSGQKRTGWPELEQEFRCVILAEAGAGKSFEMEARAKHSEEQGRAAFFIRIEDIEDDFDEAFEIGSAESFQKWLSSEEDAWFFLDSVDEARLISARTFEKAIKRFASRIKSAQQRAHIYISSRPYAWRARTDRNLLEQCLPFKKTLSEEAGGDKGEFDGDAASEPVEQENALNVYLLEPLDEAGIRVFAGHRNTPKIDKLITELQRANLMSLAARPFDLEGILSKWEADQVLGGRLDLLRHSIDLRLNEIDADRAQRQPINREKAKCGARVLAAAVILTGEPGIRIPDSTHPESGIDAEAVLGDWQPTEVRALLERGLFNDALYGIVRFRHREVRELLAAEWFLHQLRDGCSRHAIESLFFREQYGHLVIRPRLRPVLPWLILFDDEIRRKALEIAPEIAVEGGDVAYLPLSERQMLLHTIVTRIAKDEGGRSARDNSAIARIAQADLTGDTLRLITDHRENDDAIFFLGRLVWQGEMAGCLPVLSEIACNSDRGIYARIAATRAVMTCGDRYQKDQLWKQLTTSSESMPRTLLAEVIGDADPDMISVDFLLASIDKLEVYERYEATGLRQALHDFLERLPIYGVKDVLEPLAVIVSGVNEYLNREPYIERRECHVSEPFAWLLGPATHAVERLVSARSLAALSPDALAIMLKVPVAQLWHGEDFDEYKSRLRELVPAWHELNDALFWRSVEDARERLDAKKSVRLIDDWSVQWIGHYWSFGIDRFDDVLDFVASRHFLDDKLVALSLGLRLFQHADKPDDWLSGLTRIVDGNLELKERLDTFLNPVPSQSAAEWEENEARRKDKRKKKQEELDRNRAKWVEHLKAAPYVVCYPQGLKPGELSSDQYWLLNEIEGGGLRTSRGDGANWESLIPEFGEDVARAYRDAAIAHWRTFTPGIRSEGHDTKSIPYSLIFAMVGLEIEASEVASFPSSLTEVEVRHALRYFVWDINGFPRWLEQLQRAYPGLVLEAVLTELQWELVHTQPDQQMHYILHDLVYHASWMHPFLVPAMVTWLEQNEIPNRDALRYCIRILISGDTPRETLLKLAKSKILSHVAREDLAAWYALWIDLDAEQGISAVEVWLSSLPTEKASQEAQLLVTGLMGTRRSRDTGLSCGDFCSVKNLKALYVLMHRHIRAQDDIERAGKGVYSPGLRDDAQDGRNALFSQLSEIPGKQTYVALAELARDHPSEKYRPWMRELAYKRAEQDADLEPWSAQQVREYDQGRVSTPTTHRQLFDLTVNRLLDLKAWVECGNDSPYKTWQRADGETEMRNLIAGWLNGQSSGRYSCAQENELANRQRPDIWMQHLRVGSPVPIELKVLDKGWSGPELCERLRNQLAGDYLREEASGSGVFLLVWQGQSAKRSWNIDGRRVALSNLCKALGEYWETISESFPGVEAIEVILIDLTVRDKKSAV
ncbi:hypothetical protein [Pseudomonas sp.]|uniref:NACHT domain-containing protein n=1 Tax=Pseudomonas sp. TaxID=306 RepID=UPI002BF33053|nr:hypothetical protein [Pseudomonas sp.]HUE93128.1 hypothetical protein [Pseudomonas sp.]